MRRHVLVLVVAWLVAGFVFGQELPINLDDKVTLTLEVPLEVDIAVSGGIVELIFASQEDGSWFAEDDETSTLTITNNVLEDAVGEVTVSIVQMDGPLSHSISLTLALTGEGCPAGVFDLLKDGEENSEVLLAAVEGLYSCSLTWTATSPLIGTPPSDDYEFEITFTLIVEEDEG